jgi:rhamnogalacturonan acetylesterase
MLGLLALLAPTIAAAKIYLCGDSTMEKDRQKDKSKEGKTKEGTSISHQFLATTYLPPGWGVFFGAYVDLPVINKAIGGRSARSFTEEKRFQEVAGLVAPGDCEYNLRAPINFR